MTMKGAALENVVIVGASAAGLSAADGLREGGYEGRIIILGDEQHEPYDRPTLSKRLVAPGGAPHFHAWRPGAGRKAADVPFIPAPGGGGPDADRHYVVTENGDALPWDAVII